MKDNEVVDFSRQVLAPSNANVAAKRTWFAYSFWILATFGIIFQYLQYKYCKSKSWNTMQQ